MTNLLTQPGLEYLQEPWASAPATNRRYPAAVERWRPDVAKLMPADLRDRPDAALLVDKLLHAADGESGGNPNVPNGDGGLAKNLFQSHYLRDGATPEEAIADAWRLVRNRLNAGGTGFEDWGENNSYEGKPFGAFGNYPYANGTPTEQKARGGGVASSYMSTTQAIRPPNTGDAGIAPSYDDVARSVTQRRISAEEARSAVAAEQNRAYLEQELGTPGAALPHEEAARTSHGADPAYDWLRQDTQSGFAPAPEPGTGPGNYGDVPYDAGGAQARSDVPLVTRLGRQAGGFRGPENPANLEPGPNADYGIFDYGSATSATHIPYSNDVADVVGQGAGAVVEQATTGLPGYPLIRRGVAAVGGPELPSISPADVIPRLIRGQTGVPVPEASQAVEDVTRMSVPTNAVDLALTAAPFAGEAGRVASAGRGVLERAAVGGLERGAAEAPAAAATVEGRLAARGLVAPEGGAMTPQEMIAKLRAQGLDDNAIAEAAKLWAPAGAAEQIAADIARESAGEAAAAKRVFNRTIDEGATVEDAAKAARQAAAETKAAFRQRMMPNQVVQTPGTAEEMQAAMRRARGQEDNPLQDLLGGGGPAPKTDAELNRIVSETRRQALGQSLVPEGTVARTTEVGDAALAAEADRLTELIKSGQLSSGDARDRAVAELADIARTLGDPARALRRQLRQGDEENAVQGRTQARQQDAAATRAFLEEQARKDAAAAAEDPQATMGLASKVLSSVRDIPGAAISLKSSLSPPFLRQGLARLVTNPVAAARELGTSLKASLREGDAVKVLDTILSDPWVRSTKNLRAETTLGSTVADQAANKGYTWADVGGQILDWRGAETLNSKPLKELQSFAAERGIKTEGLTKEKLVDRLARELKPEELQGFGGNSPLANAAANFLPVKLSDRQASLELNLHRTNWYREVASKMWQAGERDVKAYEQLRKTIENFTHRGSWSQGNVPFLFSTRAASGRAQAAWRALDALSHPLALAQPGARQEAAKAFLGVVGTNLAMIIGANEAGKALGFPVNIEMSGGLPTLRYGAHHWDPWAGWNAPAKMAFGVAKDIFSEYGKALDQGSWEDIPQDFAQKLGQRSEQFIRKGLSPAFGKGADIVTGKDYTGKPYSLAQDIKSGSFITNLAAPFVIEGIADAYKQDGLTAAGVLALPQFLSTGINTYTATRDVRNDTASQMFVYDNEGNIRERQPGQTGRGPSYNDLFPENRAKVDASAQVQAAAAENPSDYRKATDAAHAPIRAEVDRQEALFKNGQNTAALRDVYHDESVSNRAVAPVLENQFAKQFAGFDKNKYEKAVEGYYGIIDKPENKIPAGSPNAGAPDFDKVASAQKDYLDSLPADQRQWITEALQTAEEKKTPLHQRYDTFLDNKKAAGYFKDGITAAERKALDVAHPELDAESWFFGGTATESGGQLLTKPAVDQALAIIDKEGLKGRTVHFQGADRDLASEGGRRLWADYGQKLQNIYDDAKLVKANQALLDWHSQKLYNVPFAQANATQRARLIGEVRSNIFEDSTELDALHAFMGFGGDSSRKVYTYHSPAAKKYIDDVLKVKYGAAPAQEGWKYLEVR